MTWFFMYLYLQYGCDILNIPPKIKLLSPHPRINKHVISRVNPFIDSIVFGFQSKIYVVKCQVSKCMVLWFYVTWTFGEFFLKK